MKAARTRRHSSGAGIHARDAGREIIVDGRRLGLTQADLARRAGIRPETLNRIEQGRHSPSIATVDKIDRALKEVEAEQSRQPRRRTTLEAGRTQHATWETGSRSQSTEALTVAAST